MFNSTATSRRTWTNVQNQLSTSRESLGAYPTYADAQRVVDALADQRFEVQTTQIVGSDLRMVEQITGRLTWPRAILSGAAGGAWFGLFVGLLNLLSTATFLRAMAFGLFWGGCCSARPSPRSGTS